MAKALMQPKLLNVDRTPHRPKKRRKITLAFDEGKRREFLQGFRKRKLQRQQKAKEELQKQLKEEKKRIKQEARELYKKLVSSRDIPEIQQQLHEEDLYETKGHTVSIVELNMQDLSKKNALIGDNRESDSNAEEEMSDTESRHSEEIVGMSLEERQSKSTKASGETKSENRGKSGTDVKREIKRTASRRVKGSKAFQLKQRLERNKNRKESLRTRKRVEKIQRKRKGKKSKH